MYPELERNLRDLSIGALKLTADRETSLALIATWMKEKRARKLPVHLVFICTHNSRRSQFAHAWASAATLHQGMHGVHVWSAGTEATEVAPPVIEALKAAGFRMEGAGDHDIEGNLSRTEYLANMDPDVGRVLLYSKTINEPDNPTADFAAIMVCSDAEQNCPFVPGASARFSLPYTDPKASDGTPDEARTYRMRSEEIGSEMVRLMLLASA